MAGYKDTFQNRFLCNQKGWGTIIRTYVRNMMKKLDLNSIKISLIIPTLNAAEYMPGLIDILGQTEP